MSSRDLLLEYAFPIQAIEPLPAASAAYLKKAVVIVPGKGGSPVYGVITECTTKSQVQALTDSECWRMLDAGMNSIFVLVNDDLDVESALANYPAFKYFTILVDPYFTTAHTTLEVGTFAGVVGWATETKANAQTFAQQTNHTAFLIETDATNPGANMFHAFGKLLSSRDWKNQQYIEVPVSDAIDELSEANDLFEKKISFCLTSEEYGNRLALFANNRKAIVAPYIFEWFKLSIQSWGVQYIALNQPDYTAREASLLQDFLEEKAEERFVASEIVESLSVNISLVEDNFVANGDLVVAEPKALWRVNSVVQQGIL